MHHVFEQARENMVDGQIRPAGVTHAALLEALRTVPRERFVPRHLQGIAYVDEDVPLGHGRWLPEPRVIARLVQAAEVKDSDVVLDIGCGTGYSCAVLGSLASTVVGLERNPQMAEAADKLLHELGVVNAVVVQQDDLSLGYTQQGPYNVIVINGSVPAVPQAVCEQLAEGGRLVAVVSEGRRGHMGFAVRVTRRAGTFETRALFDAALPPLEGFGARKQFVF